MNGHELRQSTVKLHTPHDRLPCQHDLPASHGWDDAPCLMPPPSHGWDDPAWHASWHASHEVSERSQLQEQLVEAQASGA